MEKGSATVFVLLTILILTGAGWYFFSKPQNFLPQITRQIATADKTYQNSKFNFELKYQKDLFVKEDSEEEYNKRGNGDFRKNFKGYVGYEPGKFAGAVVILDKSNSYETNPFTVWVFNNDKNLGADEWYKEYWYYPFVWGDFTQKGKVELAPKDEATVSGLIGKSGIIDYQPGKPKFVYISSNGKMYLFRIIGEEGNKILSTFKFLNSQADEIVDWKTYTDDKFGFSIRYPSDFHTVPTDGKFPVLTLAGPDQIIIHIYVNSFSSGEEKTISYVTNAFVNKIIPLSKAKLIDRMTIRVGGTEGEKLIFGIPNKNGVVNLAQIALLIIHKDKWYHFTTGYGTDYSDQKFNNKEKALKIFDQILSTFKFTQ